MVTDTLAQQLRDMAADARDRARAVDNLRVYSVSEDAQANIRRSLNMQANAMERLADNQDRMRAAFRELLKVDGANDAAFLKSEVRRLFEAYDGPTIDTGHREKVARNDEIRHENEALIERIEADLA